MKRTLATFAIASTLVGAGSGIALAEDAAPVTPTPAGSRIQNEEALDHLGSAVGTAAAVGGLGGTIAGAVIGCAAGGLLASPTVVFVPAACLTGLVLGASVGGVIGTIVVGGPTLIVTGIEYVQVLMTPAP